MSGPVGAIDAAVEDRADDLVALAGELVRFRSENPKLLADAAAAERAQAEEAACQSFVAGRLAALGLTVERFPALPGRDDVVGRLAGTGGGRSLILNGHVDVVPAGDPEQWPHEPWSGTVAGGRLLGRGSCDMKGGIACGIVALHVLAALGVRLAGDVLFQSVVDEETGGPGTREALARGHLADAALVLEPTGLAPQPVEGGLEWLRVVVRGRTGHSAVRYRSVHAGGQGSAVSAIEKAMKLLAAVQELERHWGNTKVHPLLPAGITTINPGMIAGGSGGGRDGVPSTMLAYSNFADYCALGLSLKYLPGERAEDVRREFEDYVARVSAADPWLAEHPPEIEWGIAGVSFPPSEVPLDHPFARAVATACEPVLGAPRWRGFEAVSDLAWIAAAGIPGMLFGPGDFAQAHSSAEFVEVAELVAATKVIARVLVEWCGYV